MKKIKMLTLIYIGARLMVHSPNTLAFSKLKNGFESLTSTYLLPLVGAVAGAALITYIILSFFKQEEYQKKVASVFGLSVVGAAGLEVLNSIIQNFS